MFIHSRPPLTYYGMKMKKFLEPSYSYQNLTNMPNSDA